jgi:hypothetical protein
LIGRLQTKVADRMLWEIDAYLAAGAAGGILDRCEAER